MGSNLLFCNYKFIAWSDEQTCAPPEKHAKIEVFFLFLFFIFLFSLFLLFPVLFFFWFWFFPFLFLFFLQGCDQTHQNIFATKALISSCQTIHFHRIHSRI